MRKLIYSLLFVCVFSISPALFALDPSCFREEAKIEKAPANTFAVYTATNYEPIFFTQGGNILPSSETSDEKVSPLPYTASGVNDTTPLRDDDRKTVLVIDPYELAKGDVTLLFDLGKVYTANTLSSRISYSSDTPVRIYISRDLSSFIETEGTNLENFDFRYVRIIFERPKKQNNVSILDTVTFFENKKARFIVSGSVDTIIAYRGFGCDTSLLSGLLAQRGPSQGNRVDIPEVNVTFSQNPLYQNDLDRDGIMNLRDNCPSIANPDQQDRNHDGIGDVCSDDDGDGIYGTQDNCPTIKNPDQKDINANGIGDACEFDTDKDGAPDGNDNCIHTPNPDQLDRDNDGIGDACDTCALYNPDQLDLDKNNIGDVCDRQREYEKTNDEDADTILDMSDNCKKKANPDQLDTDKDGIGDACDNCPSIQNTDQKDENRNGIGDACEDSDGDTIEGWRDNCPTVKNVDQKDANNDERGDACEDTDQDRIFDGLDNCPLIYNPDQKDIDHDGIGNACDPKDNRFLESNRTLFMILFGVIGLCFIGAIIFFMRKISGGNEVKKNSK